MNILSLIFFLVVMNNKIFIIIFGILTIICLIIFKWLFTRKLNNKPVKSEGLIIIFNTILLIVSMCLVALSGWAAIMQHYT